MIAEAVGENGLDPRMIYSGNEEREQEVVDWMHLYIPYIDAASNSK